MDTRCARSGPRCTSSFAISSDTRADFSLDTTDAVRGRAQVLRAMTG